MTEQQIADHAACNHTEHGGKRQLVIHRHLENDHHTCDWRPDYRTCHRCHAADGQRRGCRNTKNSSCYSAPYSPGRGTDKQSWRKHATKEAKPDT